MLQQAQRAVIRQQWQRSGILLLTSAGTLALGVPLLVLYLIGTRVELGISASTASTWLTAVVAGWVGSVVFGLFVAGNMRAMEKRERVRWLLLIAFPVTTLPAATVFAWRWREELRPQMYPERPQRRGWWDL